MNISTYNLHDHREKFFFSTHVSKQSSSVTLNTNISVKRLIQEHFSAVGSFKMTVLSQVNKAGLM